MKKFYYLLGGIAIILLTIVACQDASSEVEEMQAVQEELSGKPDAKVTICHYDADLNESYQITISEKGLNGHYGDETTPRHEGDNFNPLAVDADGDGIGECADCDDDDASPEASLKKMWYRDVDGDGFGNPELYIETCLVRDGYVADNTDCDDTDGEIFPLSPYGKYIFEWIVGSNGYRHYIEIDSYNPIDHSFTGSGHYVPGSYPGNYTIINGVVYGTIVISNGTFTGSFWYGDDIPGAGTEYPFSGTIDGCNGLSNTNSFPAIYPYADNDGDGDFNDVDCDDTDPNLNLADLDGDGYSTCDGDCDDNDASINPGAVEICDGIDNDCDGDVDEGVTYSPLGEIFFYYKSGGFLKGLHSMNIDTWDGTNFSGSGLNLNSNGGNYYNAVSAVVSGTVDPQTHVFTGTLYYPGGDPTSNTYKFYGYIKECGGIELDHVNGDFYGPIIDLLEFDPEEDGFSGYPIPN